MLKKSSQEQVKKVERMHRIEKSQKQQIEVARVQLRLLRENLKVFLWKEESPLWDSNPQPSNNVSNGWEREG